VKKREIAINELYEGFPKEFQDFINYIKNLEFTEVPDYDYLRQLLKNILIKIKANIDFYYDWDEVKPEISKDNIIYKNDYHIEYNGKNEWLIRNKDNRTNFSNNKSFYNSSSKKPNNGNIYAKPIFPINQVPSFKNTKTIPTFNIKLHSLKTADNTPNESKAYESIFNSSRKKIKYK